MKKIGLLLLLVEIVALIIMGYNTANVPSRPKIDPIQLQQNQTDPIDEDINKSENFLRDLIFGNPTKSNEPEITIFYSLARDKKVALAINSQ